MSTTPTKLHTVKRYSERVLDERAALDDLLDVVPVGILSTVVDGEPLAVPMLFARDGDRVLLHGSTGAGALRTVASGAPAVLSVTALDGIVVAESTFNSSANYRSAAIRGRLTPLTDDDKATALERLSERLIPGRTSEVPAMTAKELAATLAMALPIADGSWVLKTRIGPPSTPEVDTDAWCGVVPLRTVAGPVEPAAWVPDGASPPESVRRLIARVEAGGLR